MNNVGFIILGAHGKVGKALVNYCTLNNISHLKVAKSLNVSKHDELSIDFNKPVTKSDLASLLHWKKGFEMTIVVNAVWKGVGSQGSEKDKKVQFDNLKISQNILDLVVETRPNKYIELGSYEGEFLDRAKNKALVDYKPSNLSYAFSKALTGNLSRLYSYLNNIPYCRFCFSAPVLAMSDNVNTGRGYVDSVITAIKEGKTYDKPRSSNFYDFIPLHILAENIIKLAPESPEGGVVYLGYNIGLTLSQFFRALEDPSFKIESVKRKLFSESYSRARFLNNLSFDIKDFM